MNRNKLKINQRKKNLKLRFWICFFLLTVIFLFAEYFFYSWRCYTSDMGLSLAMGINEIMSHLIGAFDYLGAPTFSVPITAELFAEIALQQLQVLWWAYLLIIVCFLLSALSQRDRDYRGIEKGSADWADDKELEDFTDDTGIPLANNFYVTVENKGKKFYAPHNLNEMVIGGSGAGKTFRKIKPDIMQMFGSYVVTDPKGELYRDTAKLLKANGYKVKVLNLINIEYTNSYNPFVYMRSEQDVISVADLFMKNTAGEGEKDDFWSNSAKDLLVAIMIYLFKTDSETKSFGRVVRLVNSIKYDDGIVDSSCELAQCMDEHSTKYPVDAASINWGSVKGTPEQTMGGIAKSLSTRLGLWAVEAVDLLTATDEMDFDNIGVEKTAIFVLTPPARNPYKAIVNIFYSQLFERLMYCANFMHNGRLPRLVSCELDEFANIGKIPNFNETLSVVRSHNIRICIVLQGLSQLKALYDKIWESIIGNCSLFLFLGTKDQDTREYVVKLLGKTTVRSQSDSHNRGGQGGGSRSDHFDSRELVTVDELPKIIAPRGKSKKYGGSCVILIDEYSPFYIYKFDILKHPLFPETGGSFDNCKHNNTVIEKEYADHQKKKSEEASNAKQAQKTKIEQLMEIGTVSTDYDEQLSLMNIFEGSDNTAVLTNESIVVEEIDENQGWEEDEKETPEEFDETELY